MHIAIPVLAPGPQVQQQSSAGTEPARLAWQHATHEGKVLTLVAGKRLSERAHMLAAYRLTL